ncbi:CDP-alcohol phosphatidyltransferase family protein [Arthrobacter sp. UYEF20]|uniref:CDP-alcohol phosphatidyltransferase family protein n=1 Tax=Arthrobacter sp. UYEF20 TaxID=1756363 RepID=UPI0033926FE2
MDSRTAQRAVVDVTVAMGAFLAAGTWLCVTAFPHAAPQHLTLAAALAAGSGVIGCAAASVLRRDPPLCTPADRVTLIRAVLVACCAALTVAGVMAGSVPGGIIAVLGTTAFLLDAVDGRVARFTGTASAAGSRLDTDTDGALVLVLSGATAGTTGPWTLGIGLMYYAFLAAGWFRPSLREPLPPKMARKVIGAFQPAALLLALIPGVPPALGMSAAAVAFMLLGFSFGRDVVELERLRRDDLATVAPRA